MRTTSVAGVLAALGASFAIAADSDIETSASATRRVLFVANNGVDSISCGNWGSPCRSIGQSLDNAVDGDQILVGPGRYGDLNSDGDFDDGGEERARQPGIESGCVICIGKRIHVASIAGAAATIVDGGNPEGDFPFIVFIPTSGVTFGERDKGFTLKDGQAYGLKSNASKVRVAGNVALNNPAFGFQFEGSGNVASNISIGSTTGFDFEGDFTLTNNTAIGHNGPGFRIAGRPDNWALVVGNTAHSNVIGFLINGQRLVVRTNIAIDNGEGFHVDAPDLKFERNATIGNKGAGLSVGPSVVRGASRILANNIYGNDVDNNCGITNLHGNIVDAPNNFWGSPTGPGPDPADNAGPGCDMHGSSTITTPFATRPFAINW